MSETAANAATAKPAPGDVIEAWFRESFHGSALATNTEHFNLVRRAVDGLKGLLASEAPPAQAPVAPAPPAAAATPQAPAA